MSKAWLSKEDQVAVAMLDLRERRAYPTPPGPDGWGWLAIVITLSILIALTYR